MTDELYVPTHPIRFVTAASLFDGHDAAINIMRRILQRQGAEVIHLGHNRSVDEVVTAAIQEDAQGVAISSYQGGHVEYFSVPGRPAARARRRAREGLRRRRGRHRPGRDRPPARPRRRAHLLPHRRPAHGPAGDDQHDDPRRATSTSRAQPPSSWDGVFAGEPATLARALSGRRGRRAARRGPRARRRSTLEGRAVPVLGITGTGGSGKSSLTDELVRRFRLDQEDKLRIAVLAVDPTRRKGGGALLGDRIRMNALGGPQVYFRSMASRGSSGGTLPEHLGDAIAVLRASGRRPRDRRDPRHRPGRRRASSTTSTPRSTS